MAKLRPAAPEVDRRSIPVPLRDPGHRVWRDPNEFAQMCAAFGVDTADRVYGDLGRAPWPYRFEEFRERWCMANGYAHHLGYGMDYAAVEAAGINVGHGRYRLRKEESYEWVG